MIDVAKSETFKNLTIFDTALLFLIKLNKISVQSGPKNYFIVLSFFKTVKNIFPHNA